MWIAIHAIGDFKLVRQKAINLDVTLINSVVGNAYLYIMRVT